MLHPVSTTITIQCRSSTDLGELWTTPQTSSSGTQWMDPGNTPQWTADTPTTRTTTSTLTLCTTNPKPIQLQATTANSDCIDAIFIGFSRISVLYARVLCVAVVARLERESRRPWRNEESYLAPRKRQGSQESDKNNLASGM